MIREPTELPDSCEEEMKGFFVITNTYIELRADLSPGHPHIELQADLRPGHPHSVYGVGVNCPFRDELPEWAQTAIALLDIGSQTPHETVTGVGYKGTKYYEFIGPKYED